MSLDPEEGSQPTPRKGWAHASRLMTFLGGAAGIVAAAGVVLGVYEYRQRNEASQARETLNMIEVWDTQGAHVAYRGLSARVQDLLNQVPGDQLSQVQDDRTAYQKLRENIARRALSDAEQQAQFEDVVYFFTRLGLCIDARLCSEEVAAIFYKDTLGSFIEVFEPAIRAMQKRSDSFGATVIDLNGRFKRN